MNINKHENDKNTENEQQHKNITNTTINKQGK